MIIFLSELQKKHLDIIHQHSTQVLIDICKLAIDYLKNGINQSKLTLAADKLNVEETIIQNVLQALVYLLVDGCKHKLSEADFKSSLVLAGFSSEKQEVLVKLYTSKKKELSEAICLLQQNDAKYQDLKWRFEVQTSSRGCAEEIKPMVLMDFILMTTKDYRLNNDITCISNNTEEINKNKVMSHINIDLSIQTAKAASHCQNLINHVLLQCDLPNLVNLTNKLEQAAKEAKSQHVRKVQRSLQ